MIHRMARRRFNLFLAAAGGLAVAPRVRAQAGTPAGYPARPLRWIVPYPAGGGSDFLARTLGAQLEKQLGQPVVIENRPGAATMIGAEAVARSAPDGYTVGTADNGTLVFNSALYRKVPYDAAKDFANVGLMARFPLILAANPAAGWRSAGDFIRAARATPGRLSYASAGAGSPHHLAMELIKQRTQTYVVHIPYRGAAPAVQDVLGNQVPVMIIDTAVGLPHLRAGKLVALGVLSRQRLAALPDVPTLMQQGIADIEVYAWQGMIAPAATPRDIVARLNAELVAALGVADVAARLRDFGLEPTPGSPAQMTAYIQSEIARWHALIRAQNLTLD